MIWIWGFEKRFLLVLEYSEILDYGVGVIFGIGVCVGNRSKFNNGYNVGVCSGAGVGMSGSHPLYPKNAVRNAARSSGVMRRGMA